MSPLRRALIWSAILCLAVVPILIALASPLLAWRSPVYIGAGVAGSIALSLLFLQPLAAAGALPGLSAPKTRRLHRLIGIALVLAVVAHVAGLWITSPPDVIDALLFASPTPFSIWGVIAMWALFAAAGAAILRRRLRLKPIGWRRVHSSFAILVALGTVAHALLIEGTMEPVSKALLCGAVLLATGASLIRLNMWTKGPSSG
jgi:hypothetical protein